jgi:TonB family protein
MRQRQRTIKSHRRNTKLARMKQNFTCRRFILVIFLTVLVFCGSNTFSQVSKVPPREATHIPDALKAAVAKEGTARLSLVDQGLTTFPIEILQLSNLQVLDIERNYISSLPEQIGTLSKLQQLFLLQNNLDRLPEGMAQLAALRVLDLGGNQLASFPEQIMSLKALKALDLSSNQITAIPAGIKDFQALKILLLHSNQITQVSDELFELKNLATLDISGNPLTLSEFERITKAMPNTKVITTTVVAPSVPQSNSNSDEVFALVEVSASPIGGMGAFYEHAMKEMTYPPDARRMGIQGKVFVEFVVNKDGSISDVRVVKGIGGGCDEEAVRVVRIAPAWKAGTQKGQPIRQRMVLPITFKLG